MENYSQQWYDAAYYKAKNASQEELLLLISLAKSRVERYSAELRALEDLVPSDDKNTKYEGKMKSVIVALVAIFFLIMGMIWCNPAHAQSIGLGIGVTSLGKCSAIGEVTYKEHGCYFKSIQEAVVLNEIELLNGKYIEQHEITIGYIHRIHERVSLIFGFGWNRDNYVQANEYGSNYYSFHFTGQSLEYGWKYDVISREYVNLSVNAIFSTYSGLNTMVSITKKFRK